MTFLTIADHIERKLPENAAGIRAYARVARRHGQVTTAGPSSVAALAGRPGDTGQNSDTNARSAIDVPPPDTWLPRAYRPPLAFIFDQIRHRRISERRIRVHPLQFRALRLQHSDPLHIRRFDAPVLRFPLVRRRL